MQLEVFGDLAVAVHAGAIGGNDRIVALAVFACYKERPDPFTSSQRTLKS